MALKRQRRWSCWEMEAMGCRVPHSEPQFCYPLVVRPVYLCEPQFLRLKVALPCGMTGGSEAGEGQGLLLLPSLRLSHLVPDC